MTYLRKNKGAVLILVLGAVALLSVLAIELAHRANVEVSQTARSSREGQLHRAFESGRQIAKAMLIEHRNKEGFDYWGDGWSKEIHAELEAGVSLNVRVIDESGKINLAPLLQKTANAVQLKKTLARLFVYLRQADSENQEKWNKVEQLVNQRLSIGSSKSPAPMLTLDGLREAGISAETVFGSNDTTLSRRPALSDYLTMFGEGKINLNTAPEGVFFALDDEITMGQAQKIATWRGEEGGGKQSVIAFRKVKDLENVEGMVVRSGANGQQKIIKNLLEKIKDRVAVSSTAFSAKIIVNLDGRQRVGWCFFETAQTGPEPVKIVAFEEIEP